MTGGIPVSLWKLQSQEMVAAELFDNIGEAQIVDWKSEWLPAMLEGVQRLKKADANAREPQSSHWNWRKKAEALQNVLARRGFSLVCEGMTQGMMVVDTAVNRCRIDSQRGQHLVYVSYVEAAPWNQRLLYEPPRYSGVGSLLMRAAIDLSLEEGFKGRIGLHSLPQANDFYGTSCGMTDLGFDAEYRMRYFEMTSDQAHAFVAKGDQP
ncbi:MAG: GNAT family N-acetyltransferase [Gemmatimonadota bacterium]